MCRQKHQADVCLSCTSNYYNIWKKLNVIYTVSFQFEKSSRLSREAEDQLNVIPKFCFPDPQDWKPSAHTPRSAAAPQWHTNP